MGYAFSVDQSTSPVKRYGASAFRKSLIDTGSGLHQVFVNVLDEPAWRYAFLGHQHESI
jgi:hypothetical protein